jgi:hypothetical protein
MPEAGQVALSHELTALIRDVLSAWTGPPLRLVYVTDAGFHPDDYFRTVLSRMPDPHRPGCYYQWEWVITSGSGWWTTTMRASISAS